MALWSNKTVQVPGLTAVYASTGPITAQNRRHYILDTTSNAITINLPSGVDGHVIRITDAKGTFLTNNVTVTPASGQKINNLAVNESLLLDANEMWIEFTWNALAASWIVNAPGILGLITNTYTDYPYISSPSSPATSNLRLYAKSDGKLYVKDSSGTESKVGGGLDHPTTGSTFEAGAANVGLTGWYNTAIGVGSGSGLLGGDSNTLFGQAAGQLINTGTTNTGVGAGSLASITSGSGNTALGKDSLLYTTTGSQNVAIGVNAGNALQSSSTYNTAINTAIGTDNSVNLSGVVAIGRDSSGGYSQATSNNQFVLGTSNHLYRLPGVVQIIKIGQTTNNTSYVQLQSATSGSPVTWTLPVSNGTNGQTLITNGSGTLSWSTILGLVHPTTESTFETGTANASMTGTGNTAIGYGAGVSLTSGAYNAFYGTWAGANIIAGSQNTALGYNALGQGNHSTTVAIGYSAINSVNGGSQNVIIGTFAGYNLSGACSYNTIINSRALASAGTFSGIVAIGMDSSAGWATATGSNQFVLGTANHLYRFPGVAQTSLVLGPTGTSTGQTGTLSFRELAANGTHVVTLRAADTIAADVTFTLPSADGTSGQFLTTNGSGVLSWGTVNTSNSTITVTQNSHGFTTADIGKPVYLNGSTYTLAKADLEATAEVAGLINSIVDTNNFKVCLSGEVSSIDGNSILENGSTLAAYTDVTFPSSPSFPALVSTTNFWAETFTLNSSVSNISTINIALNTGTGNAYIEVYAANVSTHQPTGSVLATSNTVALSSVSNTNWTSFTFTPFSLSSGYYIFVVKTTGSAFIGGFGNGSSYAGQALTFNTGTSTWTLQGIDLYFQVKSGVDASLVAGTMYFLSASIAGKITATPPSVVGQISKPVGIARSTSALDFYNMRGSAVGGTNVYTQIGLSNNATTTIQNVSAYNSVELQGWIYINATTPYRYLFKAQVTKKGDGTDYLISFQHSGDTPPTGFNITVTAAGLVQVTLPSISGFTSAIAQFNLNGPAVGVSLPLQINSSLITLNSGIQFPATMIPSSDPNNLDDYEEGVWSPSLYGSSTAGTWTPSATQTGGYYIKIGKLVYLFINLNGTLSGAAGNLFIGNLPFVRATANAGNAWNATYSAFTMAYGNGLTWTAGHYCSGWLIDPSNYLYGHTMPTGGGTAGTVPVTNGAVNIHITGAYYTN